MSRFSPLLLIMSCLLLSNFLNAQCSAPFNIDSQSKLNNYFSLKENCTTILGDLRIGDGSFQDDDFIYDLSPLSKIEAIEGNLVLENLQILSSLDGLESLKEVTGSITVNNCPELISIDILAQVATANSFSFNHLPSLISFPSLTNSHLEFIALNDLTLQDLSFIQDIGSMDRINLHQCNELIDISAIEEIPISSFTIIENENLSDCALENICELAEQNAYELTIYGNSGECEDRASVLSICLPDSTFCLTTELSINNQSELNDINNIPDVCLENITNIWIYEFDLDDPVTDLSPLSRFEHLNVLSFNRTSSLTSLEGLENLKSVNHIRLQRNDKLASTASLSADLINITLNISSNPLLEDLPEFLANGSTNQITILDQKNQILNGLEKLTQVENITIEDSQVGDLSFLENNNALTHFRMINVSGVESIQLSQNGPGLSFFDVVNCENLTSVSNLHLQDSVSLLQFIGDELTTIHIPQMAEYVNEFKIWGKNLNDLDFASFPKHINRIEFAFLESLDTLNVFDELISVNFFAVAKCSELKHIGATKNLAQSLFSVRIVDNPDLESIAAFDNDITAQDISIINNPKLATCGVQMICNTYRTSPSSNRFNISQNLPGCSSETITTTCPDIRNPYTLVDLDSQNDIENLAEIFPEMDSIFGNLIIDLDANSGELDPITDISFLNQLKYIQGELNIVDFRLPNLGIDFSPLDSVYYSALNIEDCDLNNFPLYHGGENLRHLHLDGIVLNLDDLSFNGLKSITNTLKIRNFYAYNDSPLIVNFEDLDSVSQLESTNIVLDQNTFPALKKVEHLSISNQDSSSVEFILDLEVQKTLELNYIDGLREFSLIPFEQNELEQIKITNCEDLTSISGLNECENCNTSLFIGSNQHLTNIDVFENATQINEFQVQYSPLVKSLSSPNLTSANRLSIIDIDSLSTIDFRQLQSVGNVTIDQNSSITNLSGINPTADINRLEITNNKILDDCNIELLCNNVSASNQVIVNNNLGICEFQAAILDTCGFPDDNCLGQENLVIESSQALSNYLKYYNNCPSLRGLTIDIKDEGSFDTIVFENLRIIDWRLNILNTNANAIVFKNLESVTRNIVVRDTSLQFLSIPKLAEIDREFTVEGCNKLENLELSTAYEGALLGNATGSSLFTIVSNPLLKTVSLNKVIPLRTVEISNNSSLQSIDAIIEGSQYYTIKYHDNPALVSGLTFRASRIVEDLEISNLDLIKSIIFEDEVSAKSITISDMEEIENIFLQINGNSTDRIFIENNPNLKEILGLQNDTINEEINIVNNPSLEHLDFLSKNITCSDLRIEDNHAIDNLVLNLSEENMGVLTIKNNQNLNSISGLQNVSIHGNARLENNPKLTNLDIFHSTSNFRRLWIWNNESLESINLDSLDYFDDFGLSIRYNDNLDSISGLHFEDMKWLYVTDNPILETIEFTNDTANILDLNIVNNPQYTDCPNAVICHNIALQNTVFLESNGIGCQDVEEVELACFSSTDQEFRTSNIEIYPNPAYQYLEYQSTKKILRFEIYDISGKLHEIPYTQAYLDVSPLDKGQYILKVVYGDQVEILSFIKM